MKRHGLRCQGRRRGAFGLIELLVVIIILAGLLPPVFAQAKVGAVCIQCIDDQVEDEQQPGILVFAPEAMEFDWTRLL